MSDGSGDIKGSKTGLGIPSWFLELSGNEEPKVATQDLSKGAPSSGYQKEQPPRSSADGFLHSGLWKCDSTATDGVFPNQQLVLDAWDSLPWGIRSSSLGRQTEEKLQSSVTTGDEKLFEEAKREVEILLFYYDYEVNVRQAAQRAILEHFPNGFPADKINFEFFINIPDGLYDYEALSKSALVREFRALPSEKRAALYVILFALKSPGFTDDNLLENPLLAFDRYEEMSRWVEQRREYFKEAELEGFLEKVQKTEEREAQKDLLLNDSARERLEIGSAIQQLAMLKKLEGVGAETLPPEEAMQVKAFLASALIAHDNYLKGQESAKSEIEAAVTSPAQDFASILVGTAQASESLSLRLPANGLVAGGAPLILSYILSHVEGLSKDGGATKRSPEYSEFWGLPRPFGARNDRAIVRAALEKLAKDEELDPSILELATAFTKAEVKARILGLAMQAGSAEVGGKLIDPVSEAESLDLNGDGSKVQKILDDIDLVSLANSIDDSTKAVIEQEKLISSMVGKNDVDKGWLNKRYQTLRDNYTVARRLLDDGKTEDARARFLTVSNSPFAQSVNKEFSESLERSESIKFGARIGIIVAAGVAMSLTVRAASPWLSTAFDLSTGQLATANLLIGSGVFMGAEKALSYAALNELPYNPDAGTLENVTNLTIEYLETVGMFKFLGMGNKAYSQLVKSALFRRAEMQLVKEGAIKWGEKYTSEAARALVLERAELGIAGKILNAGGAFGAEYVSFSAWDLILATGDYIMGDGSIDPTAVMSPEAMKERFIFLFGLKLAGVIAMPISKPLHEKTAEIMLKKYKPQLDSLAKQQAAAIDKLAKYKNSGREDIGELRVIFNELKTLAKKRERLQTALVQSGMATVDQLAFTRSARKDAENIEPKLKLLKNLARLVTPKKAGEWEYKPENREDVRELIAKLITDHGAKMTEDRGVYKIKLSPEETLEIRPMASEGGRTSADRPSVVIATAVDKKGAIHTMLGQFRGDSHREYGVFLTKDDRYLVVRGDETSIRAPENEEGFFVGHTHPKGSLLLPSFVDMRSSVYGREQIFALSEDGTTIISSSFMRVGDGVFAYRGPDGGVAGRKPVSEFIFYAVDGVGAENNAVMAEFVRVPQLVVKQLIESGASETTVDVPTYASTVHDDRTVTKTKGRMNRLRIGVERGPDGKVERIGIGREWQDSWYYVITPEILDTIDSKATMGDAGWQQDWAGTPPVTMRVGGQVHTWPADKYFFTIGSDVRSDIQVRSEPKLGGQQIKVERGDHKKGVYSISNDQNPVSVIGLEQLDNGGAVIRNVRLGPGVKDGDVHLCLRAGEHWRARVGETEIYIDIPGAPLSEGRGPEGALAEILSLPGAADKLAANVKVGMDVHAKLYTYFGAIAQGFIGAVDYKGDNETLSKLFEGNEVLTDADRLEAFIRIVDSNEGLKVEISREGDEVRQSQKQGFVDDYELARRGLALYREWAEQRSLPPPKAPDAPIQGVEAFIPKLPQIRPAQEVPHEVHVYTLNDGSSVRRSSGDMIDAGMGIFLEATEDGGLKYLENDELKTELTVKRDGKEVEPSSSGDLIVYPGDVLEIGRGRAYRVTVGRETFHSDTFAPAASGDAWGHNIRMIYSRNFSDIQRSESMGGNAGSDHVAINGVYDSATGRIIFFDNPQYLPPQIRGLPEITIHYNVSSRTITNVTVGDVGGPAITETLKRLKGLDRSIPMEWHLSGQRLLLPGAPATPPAADTEGPSVGDKRTYTASLTLNTSNVQAMWDGSVSRISVDGVPVAHIAKVMNNPQGFRLVPEEGVVSISVVGREGEEHVTGPFELCDGDIIRIGDASITLVVTDTAASSNIKFQTLPPPVEVPVQPRVSSAVDVPSGGVVGVALVRGISPGPVLVFGSEVDDPRNELSLHDTPEGTVIRHYDETTAVRIEDRDSGTASGIDGRGDRILEHGKRYTISIFSRWPVLFVDGKMIVPEGIFPLAIFEIGVPSSRPPSTERYQAVPAATMGVVAIGMQRIEAVMAKRVATSEEIQWVETPDVNDPAAAGELVSAVGRLLEPFIERHEAVQTRAYVNKTHENWAAYEEAEKGCRQIYVDVAGRYKAAFEKISELAKADTRYRNELPAYTLAKISVILRKANERGGVEAPELYQDVMALAKKVDEVYSSACKKNTEAGRGIGGMPYPRAFEGIEDRAERERAYREAMAPFIEAYETDILRLREGQNARLRKAGFGEPVHDWLFERRNGMKWGDAERLAKRYLEATEETNREFVDMVAEAVGTERSDVRPWDVEYAVRKMVQDEVGGVEPTMKLHDAILVAQRFYMDKFGIDIFDPALGVVFELAASNDHYRSTGLSFSAVNGAKVVLAELNPERITLSDLRTILHEVGHLVHNVLAEENLTQKGEGYLLSSNQLQYGVAEAFARAAADAVFDGSWAEAYLPGQFSAQYMRAYAKITQKYEVYKTRRSYVLASASRIMSDPSYPTISDKMAAIAKLQRDVLGINDDGTFAFGVYHLASELYDTYFLNYVMADAVTVEIRDRAKREGSDPYKLFEPLLREGGALTEERLQTVISDVDASSHPKAPGAPMAGAEGFEARPGPDAPKKSPVAERIDAACLPGDPGGRAAGIRGGPPSRPAQGGTDGKKSTGAKGSTTVILDDFAKLFKIAGLTVNEGRKDMHYYETSEFREKATEMVTKLKMEQTSRKAGQRDIDDVSLALMNLGLTPEQFGLEPSDEARREREASEAATRKRIDERLKAHLKKRDVAASPLKADEAKRLLGLLRNWIGEPRPEDYVGSARELEVVSRSISEEPKGDLPQLRYDDVVMDPKATELMAVERKDDLEAAYQAEMGKMPGFEDAGSWYKWRGGFSRNVHGRIYFNVNMPGASQFVKYLLNEVLRPNRRAIAGFKIALNFKGVHERADSAVLYFDSAYEQVILNEVLRFARKHPEFTKDATPEFAAPLADSGGQPVPGVSFGEEPFEVEGSFNSVRKNALNDALAEARKMIKGGVRLNWQAVAMLIRKALVRYGIDPDMPVFNVGGSENFEYIARHIYERPVEANEIIKPIPTTPPDNIELIFNGEAVRWSRGKNELVIGRGEGADIKVLAQNVSREHTILRRRADGIYELEHKGQNAVELKTWQGHLFILRTLTRTSGPMELEPGSKYELEISDTEHIEINLPK